MQIRSNAYNTGDVVISVTDNSRGIIVTMDDNRVTVEWESNNFPVVYPNDSGQIRKAFPWEG